MEGASPLWQQILFFTLGPPIGSLLVLVMSRGWANICERGNVSEETRKFHKRMFWGLLIFTYVMGACIFVYAHFLR